MPIKEEQHGKISAAELQKTVDIYHGDFQQIFRRRVEEARAIDGGMFVHQLFPDALGMMLTGMGLYKTGFLTGKRSAREYGIIAIAGYSAGLSLNAWTLSLKAFKGFHSGPMLLGEYAMDWLRHFLFGPVERAWRCLTYWERLPLRRAL